MLGFGGGGRLPFFVLFKDCYLLLAKKPDTEKGDDLLRCSENRETEVQFVCKEGALRGVEVEQIHS